MLLHQFCHLRYPLNSIMRNKPVFYIIGFVLLLVNLIFFSKAYRTLTTYAELTNRQTTVLSNYQALSRQINNAAVLNPKLISAGNSLKGEALFFTDSLKVIQQLNALKSSVRDSANIQTTEELDRLIRSELSWILASNVPDSIINFKAPEHIASLMSIDSLIKKGILRTNLIIEHGKTQLNDEIKNVRILIILFVLLSGMLLFYTSINLFKQKTQTKRKEKELETVFNRITDSVVSVDNNWRYTFLNDIALSTHPQGKEKTLGKVIWDVHPEMNGTIFWEKYHEAMQTKKVVEIEDYYAAMDIWFSVKVYPSSDGLTIFYKDISESKKIERNLLQSLREVSDYKFALDESSIIAITDQKGVINHVNGNFCKISKYSAEELIGQDHRIVNSGYHPKEFIRNIWTTIAKGKIWKGEIKNKAKDGSIYWVDTTIVPFLDDKGKPYQYVAIRSDITERKKAEDDLAKSEIHFRSLIENNADGIALTDEFSNIIYRSPSALKLMGAVPNDHTIALIHPDDLETIKNMRAKCMENPGLPVSFQGRFLHFSGHYIWLEGVLTNQLHVKGVNAVVTNFRDISARKEAEENLIASEKRFRLLIENNYDIISLMDEKFKVFYRSPSAARITGWTNEEILNMDGTKHIHPDDSKMAGNIVKELMANPGKTISTLFRNQHKDGHYLWMEGTVINLLEDDDIKAIVFNFRDITQRKNAEEQLIKSEKIYKAIASNIPGSVICLLDRDYRYLLMEGDMTQKLGYSKTDLLGNKAGDVLPPKVFAGVQDQFKRAFKGEIITKESDRNGYDVISKFVPLKDENNKVYAIMTVTIDVTKLKNAQRDISELNRSLEEKIKVRTDQLKKSNEELEAFSYSVSHDLRAPLRGIVAFANILADEYSSKLDDEAKRITSIIRDNTLKMGNLIDDLLTFSRLGKQGLSKVQVNSDLMVRDIIKELVTTENNSITWDIHDLSGVHADTNTLRQVWINFISNAIKYSGNKERPHIEIGSYQDKGQVVFYIRDNGAGFDEEYKDKLFKVFQRLHDADEFEGTGIGLALVEKIISRHEGRVWAEGKEGEGACFFFSLPQNDFL